MSGSVWLWIDRPRRAMAFLLALAIMIILLLALNRMFGWRWLLVELQLPQGAPERVVAAKQIAAHTDPALPTVLLLGGSTMREIAPDSDVIANALSVNCGRPVRVIKAGTSSQDLATAWTLAERTLDTRLDSVVVGVNYYRFLEGRARLGEGLETRRLPLPTSGTLLRQYSHSLQRIPDFEPVHQAGILLALEPRPKWIRRLDEPERLAQVSDFQGQLNIYRAPSLNIMEKRRIAASFMAMRGPASLRYEKESVALWVALTDALQAQGVRVEFLVLPMDPVMDLVRPFFDPIFEVSLKVFESRDVRITDWRDSDFGLVTEDFYDQQHMLASGREKIFDAFVRYLASSLPQCAGSGHRE
jgi:hypothetical protein